MHELLKYGLVALCFATAFQLNAQPLDTLLQRVVDQNPSLKAIQLEYQAALTKEDQIRRVPDPTVGAGIPVLRPETRLGPQVITVGVSQMFPWFRTAKTKQEVAISMSKAKYEQITALKLELSDRLKPPTTIYIELIVKRELLRNTFRFMHKLKNWPLYGLKAAIHPQMFFELTWSFKH